LFLTRKNALGAILAESPASLRMKLRREWSCATSEAMSPASIRPAAQILFRLHVFIAMIRLALPHVRQELCTKEKTEWSSILKTDA
jgi:hypothetical protein